MPHPDTIYRGYDIRWRGDLDCYAVWANGKLVDGGGGNWLTPEAAMDAIDARRRSRVAASLDPVGG